MPAWGWALIAIGAVVVLALIAMAVMSSRKRRRREALRGRFGDEYERKVQEAGRRRAETHLAEVSDRHDHLELRDLNEASRLRYIERWKALQEQFVDQPGHVLTYADEFVAEVMRERGYPVEDFDEQADLLAIDHPTVVRHYRAAHETQDRTRTGLVTTEEARVAMLQYRALFEELIAGNGSRPHESASH
jgi:hypothetical protein